MIPQPFLLAVPLGWEGRDEVDAVRQLFEVCAAGPRLWLGAGALSVTLERGCRVIGPLFRRDGHPIAAERDVTLPLGGSLETAAWLSENCWGAYLAILPEQSNGKLRVFSDPSGLLPVYRTTSRTHCLISSDPRLLAQAEAGRSDIDWTALRAHLCWPEFRPAATCLVGVDELRPGALYDLGHAAGSFAMVWQIADHLPARTVPSFSEAADALRTCAQVSISAWAELAGPIAVAASGGVDSSLICAALASGGHNFSCVTLATADPSGDERSFVEALAAHLGVAMDASTYDPATIDLTQPASAGLPRPARRNLSLAIDAALDQARLRVGADAVFDGNGGDNLFCFLHSAAPVIDRLAAEGFSAALPTLFDMCAVTGADFPTMLRAVWRRYWRKDGKDHWPPERELLADLSDQVPMPAALTPWLDPEACGHVGKRDHLALIMRAQNHIHDLSKPGVPRFSPLMSQPLVELCIGLPTWLWCHGGINRALAREAFADALPQAVLRRTSKAGPDSFLRRLFAQNRALIRTMLLDGHLAAQGLVDRPAIEAAINTDTLSKDAVVYRLLDLCEAEAWTRSWTV